MSNKKNYIQEHTFTFKSNKYLSFSRTNESVIIKVYVRNRFWHRYEVHVRSIQIPNKKAYYVCNGFFKDAYSVAQECFTRFLNNE